LRGQYIKGGNPCDRLPVAKANPFTALTPILKLKDPGPRERAHPLHVSQGISCLPGTCSTELRALEWVRDIEKVIRQYGRRQ
jgi:hypothetical protein